MAPLTIHIDLGKGTLLSFPFKRHWSVAEWRRMHAHIEGALKGVPNTEKYR